jgi:hypothetical protein
MRTFIPNVVAGFEMFKENPKLNDSIYVCLESGNKFVTDEPRKKWNAISVYCALSTVEKIELIIEKRVMQYVSVT